VTVRRCQKQGKIEKKRFTLYLQKYLAGIGFQNNPTQPDDGSV